MQPPETTSNRHPGDRSTLVLVGASVRAAAQSARRGGYRVIGVDLFGDLDTRAACETYFRWSPDDPSHNEHILQAVRGFPIEQVGGWMSGQGPLGSDLQVDGGNLDRAAPSDGPVWDTHPAALRWRRFDDLVEFSDDPVVRFPPSLRSPTAAAGTRWLRKQIDGCGGLGVQWAETDHAETEQVGIEQAEVDPTETGNREIGRDVGDDRGYVFQPWIRGRSFGATAIHDGRHTVLLGCCRSLVHRAADRPFVYGGSIGPLKLAEPVESGLTRFCHGMATRRQLRGLFNVDFMLDRNERAWILEVNPRWSASMELIERNLRRFNESMSLMRLGLQSRRERIPETMIRQIRCRRGNRFYKRIHFADRQHVFQQSTWHARFNARQSLHDFPPDGTVIHDGHPICTIMEDLDG